MKGLTDLPNIGKTLAGLLEKAGIDTPERLYELGSEKAIIRIAAQNPGEECMSKLYALEGAVQGIRWHDLSQERKEELKLFYKNMKVTNA